jgi:hypothetical protein
MASTAYLRNFESGIAALLERGHRVTLAVEHQNALTPVIQRLSRHPRFGIRLTLPISSRWDALGSRFRFALDYWRYHDPRFAGMPVVKTRAAAFVPTGLWRLDKAPTVLRSPISRLVRGIERRLPVPKEYVEQLRDLAPDVVLLTPLIYLGSSQVQWLRAARSLGLPTAFCVHSWDNLTTKGVLHDIPTAVLVWNSAQCEEAVALHDVPRERCRVTGALAFDHWFSIRPQLSRAEFLARVNLPSEGPLLLYLCSSRTITKRETAWISRWIRAVRSAADERIRSASIIVRPHPQNMGQWHQWEPPDSAVKVFPMNGESPVADQDRADYFHSLYYADVNVGLNTSALIEAAIFGKPVLSVAAPEKAKSRGETLHFSHLANGLLVIAKDLREHIEQVTAVLDVPGPSPRCLQFVEEFVRPFGREFPAGDRMAAVVEDLAVGGQGAEA